MVKLKTGDLKETEQQEKHKKKRKGQIDWTNKLVKENNGN